MEGKKARVTPAGASAVADLYLYLARLRSCCGSTPAAATVQMHRAGGNKGHGNKGPQGQGARMGKVPVWAREVRPATSGVAEWSPPLRVLTRAVRTQIEF